MDTTIVYYSFLNEIYLLHVNASTLIERGNNVMSLDPSIVETERWKENRTALSWHKDREIERITPQL